MVDKDRMLGSNGHFKTQALFLETSYNDQSSVYYTLSPFPKTTKNPITGSEGTHLPSIYQLYLDLEDVEEFLFAATYFLGMEHWRRVCEAPFFQPHLRKMREDLEKKIKSRAMQQIIAESSNKDSKNYFSALKWLAEKGYKEKAQKGRPSKAEVNRAAKESAEEKSELLEIQERLGISIPPLPSAKELN